MKRTALVVGIALAASVAIAAPQATPAPSQPAGGVVRVEHRDPTTPPTRGPALAPVTVELFFQPAPRLAAGLPILRALERLQAAHPTRMRLIYRVIKRPSNGLLALAALEAQAQGKFPELIARLHTQATSTSLTRADVLGLAREIGMDVDRLDTALSEGRYADAFAENEHRLQRLIRGSIPAVLFNSTPVSTSSVASDRELETDLRDAYSQSLDLLADGVALRDLPAAFDARARRADPPYVPRLAMRDNDDPFDPGDDGDGVDAGDQPPLASPALDLTGLPSYGPVASTATRGRLPDGPIPIVVLCRPVDTSCNDTMRALRSLQQNYPQEVRIVWGPWLEFEEDDAAKLLMLADAALCAERVGSSPKEIEASAGWIWIGRLYEVLRRGPKKGTVDDLIDSVDQDLGIDSAEMSACRASRANTALDWIRAARTAGVMHAPALVIGGRIYEGLTNGATITELVNAELAPGLLGEAAPDYRQRL